MYWGHLWYLILFDIGNIWIRRFVWCCLANRFICCNRFMLRRFALHHYSMCVNSWISIICIRINLKFLCYLEKYQPFFRDKLSAMVKRCMCLGDEFNMLDNMDFKYFEYYIEEYRHWSRWFIFGSWMISFDEWDEWFGKSIIYYKAGI